ncbi:5,10-methenyltetrahydrofolate synthetase [Peptostreptococcus russellii]|uniref:Epoxyqueuosine reductase QueH n=1 Tax=Peptostreptococcus russellii TaxID=215200 RepID=A0A1H8GVG7_9FIRM|nr:5-formyltetrahydrofolate cyclo-ligase [Peptostreptococcus russellii]SEN47268.1 5,10-methenyltetrahydrofolate synthetase [Peptostreptococcus russellii]
MANIKVNYQKELEKIIDNIDEGKVEKLLLHSCCGPCSSYVLEYLSEYFEITIFYYNPNIYPSDEYFYRVEEQKKIIELTNAKNPIHMITGKYEVEKFYKMAEGLEDVPEGGIRCHKCYEMRLREAAKIAKKGNFDYFTTTLSISPHKNSQVLNKIGEKVGEEEGVKHLPSDFKKNNGYKRSCEITKEFGMYRQDYCGCEFSKKESEERNLKKKKDELRKKMKELSNSLDKSYMEEADKKIIENLISREEYKKAKNIFTYIGKFPEIDTSIFIKKAWEDGKNIAIPYCEDDKNMVATIIKSFDDLKEGTFGILEADPKKSIIMKKEEIDLVIVPCATSDRKGNRLGFGRGYYDRFLENIEADEILLIREKQISEEVAMGEHDKRINIVITEKGSL